MLCSANFLFRIRLHEVSTGDPKVMGASEAHFCKAAGKAWPPTRASNCTTRDRIGILFEGTASVQVETAEASLSNGETIGRSGHVLNK